MELTTFVPLGWGTTYGDSAAGQVRRGISGDSAVGPGPPRNLWRFCGGAHPTFAFDAHYKLAPGFMQVLRPGHCRCVARFNVPNCLRENVNNGEENAQFKAFHCLLIRCLGVGMSADPLMCAPTMFPGNSGVYKYRPAWRARQAEILALALTGYEKKMKARRFETLHDTTLWKVHKPTRALQSTDSFHADAKARGRHPRGQGLAQNVADRYPAVDSLSHSLSQRERPC